MILISCNNTPTVSNKEEFSKPDTIKKTDSVKPVIDEKAVRLNDIAKIIAGLPVDSISDLFNITQTTEWKKYNEDATKVWGKFFEMSEKIKTWAGKEIPAATDTVKTVFYPFGGPDFLFANIFFPTAIKYIMIGLEDAGSIPVLDTIRKENLKSTWSLYKSAIEDVIQLSFFRTNDMKNDLDSNHIDGTTPIIMLFLARSGKNILEVNPMRLSDDGKLVYIDKNIKDFKSVKNHAMEIVFKDDSGSIVKRIYYLSTNLSDVGLKANLPFKAYLNNAGDHVITFLKSATYLMHKSYFSIIRNTCLNKSVLILQDDSGIGYKFFKKDKWDISLYGVYNKPIPLFEEFYEEDLFNAFKEHSKHLNFRIGYNNKSNLLIAKRIK